ncbi:type II toxin-antitoxin system Phd/YefM family antitoxin [Microcella sp.]|uniref:type II toxin-antitoxin system Phd/YefM family antitoxin n=1 Tax=Microcella sp. TaxID=1913979 RepID=UPI00391A9E36
MVMVNIYEAKTDFSKLVARAEAGERITIARNGRPVAELGPAGGITVKREPGVLAGKVWMADDFDDFTEQDERDWYGE